MRSKVFLIQQVWSRFQVASCGLLVREFRTWNLELGRKTRADYAYCSGCGKRTVNSEPFPCSVTRSIFPFRRSTRIFTIARPSPLLLSPPVGRALSFLNF